MTDPPNSSDTIDTVPSEIMPTKPLRQLRDCAGRLPATSRCSLVVSMMMKEEGQSSCGIGGSCADTCSGLSLIGSIPRRRRR